MVDIPTPNQKELKKYLNQWDSLPDYVKQENSLNKLFRKLIPNNTNIEDILIKCSTLNDFYSTNIFKVFPVAEHILSLNIDNRLKKWDPTLVNDIAKISISWKEKNFYSFASKYCSHHNDEDFPIYDNYVDKILVYFKKKDKFCKFKHEDLKNYLCLKKVLIEFINYYSLDCGLKDLDRYLRQLWKKHFPKKY